MRITRQHINFVFWALVALFLLIFPFVLSAGAQTVMLSAPEDMQNPRTGEPGAWIPRWVEQEHLLDASALKQCRIDADFDRALVFELEQKSFELESSIKHKDVALNASLLATVTLTELQTSTQSKLERRTRLTWALAGVSFAFAALTTGIVVSR